MALEKRVFSINFASGLDQKTDPKLTTKLTTAENVVLRKTGTIEKRPGYVAVGAWSATANPVRVFPFHQGEFVLTDAATDNFASTSGTPDRKAHALTRIGGAWAPRMSDAVSANYIFEPVTIRTMNLFGGIVSVSTADGAIYGASATQEGRFGFLTTGSGFSGEGSAGDYDLDTGTRVTEDVANVSNTLIFQKIKAISMGASSTIYVRAFVEQGTTQLRINASDGNSNTVASTLISGVDINNPQFDIVPFNGNVCFAVKNSSTTITIGLFTLATSATNPATLIAASTTADILTLATPAPGTDRVSLFWMRNTASNTAFMASYSATMSQILAPTSITVGLAGYGNGLIRQLAACQNSGLTQVSLFFTQSSTTGNPVYTGLNEIYSNTATTSGLVSKNFGIMHGTLSSKPWLGPSGGPPYVLIQHSATAQQSLIVATPVLSRLLPVARCLFGISAPYSTTYNALPTVSQGLNGLYYSVQRRASYFEGLGGSITINYSNELVRINMSNTQPLPSAQIADATYMAGGFMGEYDGESAFESGFLSAPTIVSATSTTVGGNVGSGTYGVVVVKQFVDQAGRVQLSAPSLPATFVTSTTTSSVTVAFYDPINFKGQLVRQGQIRYAVYRTLSNGTLYYRDTNVISTTTASVTAVSLTLISSDATLSGGDVLYTAGGALPNWTPDSVEVLCSFKDRLFTADPTDPGIVRYSKQVVPGTGVEFAQLNTILIPGVGRITALAALDSSLIVFRRNSIFVVSGDGPDDTGLNGTFSEGQLLFADIGCLDQRQLCRFRDGIAFKSDKGFYLLSRDLQLQYIGQDVESYNSKTVVSSEVVGLAEASGTAEECRFLCSDGTLLTYNYFNGQWTTATLTGCTDAVQTGGRYVVVNPSSTATGARVFQQSLTTYLDDFVADPPNGFYSMTLETGWIKTADLQGFQRLWRVAMIGETMGDGRIGVEVGYDYESAYNETHTALMSVITAANYNGGATAIPQFDFVPVRQKCQSIRFRIKDFPSVGSSGAVMKFTNISLECGVKGGVFRLPAAKGI